MARGEFNVLSAGGSEMEQELGWGVARSLFEPWLRRVPEDERAELLSGPAASASLLFGPIGETARLPASDAGFAILHGLYWLAVRAAEAQPTLLVIDDAHWADEPSLRLLEFFSRDVRQNAVLVVGTYRDAALARGPRAHALGGLIGQTQSLSVPLRALSLDEVARLVEVVSGVRPLSRGA